MSLPPVVSVSEWRAANAALIAKEKAATRASDALAAERRRQPTMEVERDYRVRGPQGDASLLDLFEGRRQLIVYSFMFGPEHPEPCSGCSMFVDNLVRLEHLNARDTTFALVSNATVDEQQAFKRRMGWDRVPWYSVAGSSFNADFDVPSGFGLNVFLRDGDRIVRTYFTTSRGVEAIGTVWSLLDRTPLGRQETWEESPPWAAQTPPYAWWRLHDEYGSRTR
jgi:predicted dithiol-disulfide oxidoreductase (DUF899 family)